MQHFSLLLGPHAKGSIGGILTTANVKGRGVIKVKPIPAYTNTPGQATQRANWKAIVALWHGALYLPADKTAFNTKATRTRRGLSGWNVFVSIYRTAFAAGLTLTSLTEITAVKNVADLDVDGLSNDAGNVKISIYSTTGSFITSSDVAVAVGAFTDTFLGADVPLKGFVGCEPSAVGEGGASGWYAYDLT